MFWANRTTRVAGILFLVMVPLIVVGVVLDGIAVGESSALARGEIAQLLADIHDNEGVFYAQIGVDIIIDGVLTVAIGAMFYVLFRDRSPVLALCALVAAAVAAASFLTEDGASVALGLLAADFAEGGPEGIAAGDPATLQAARAVAAFGDITDVIGLTALAVAMLALGLLLVGAPQGQVNPPRWLGGLAILAGIGLASTWLIAVNEDLGWMVGLVGILSVLALLAVLGGWLLSRGEQETGRATMEARPASA